MRALEWPDVDLVKRQLRVERSEWQDEVTSTKGNRVRYVPMTQRLANHNDEYDKEGQKCPWGPICPGNVRSASIWPTRSGQR
jgi:integrase